MDNKLTECIINFGNAWPFERDSTDWDVVSGDMIPYLYDSEGESWGGYNPEYDYKRSKMLLLYLSSLKYYTANEGTLIFGGAPDYDSIGQLREEMRDVFFPLMKDIGIYVLCDDYCGVDGLFESLNGCIALEEAEKTIAALDVSDDEYLLTLFIEDNVCADWKSEEYAEAVFLYTSFTPNFVYQNVHSIRGKYKNKPGVFVIVFLDVMLYNLDFEDIGNLIDIPSVYMACMQYRYLEKEVLLNAS